MHLQNLLPATERLGWAELCRNCLKSEAVHWQVFPRLPTLPPAYPCSQATTEDIAAATAVPRHQWGWYQIRRKKSWRKKKVEEYTRWIVVENPHKRSWWKQGERISSGKFEFVEIHQGNTGVVDFYTLNSAIMFIIIIKFRRWRAVIFFFKVSENCVI